MPTRPAETGGAAGAVTLLVAYFAGLHDPGVLVALATVLGFVPAAITWTVQLVRGHGSASGAGSAGSSSGGPVG